MALVCRHEQGAKAIHCVYSVHLDLLVLEQQLQCCTMAFSCSCVQGACANVHAINLAHLIHLYLFALEQLSHNNRMAKMRSNVQWGLARSARKIHLEPLVLEQLTGHVPMARTRSIMQGA
eukprot:5039199-Amphidinium_carterae.1